MKTDDETVEQLCDYLANNGNSVGEPIRVAMPGLASRIRAAHNREIAELRECLKEAIGCADEFQQFYETHPYLCKYTRDIIKKSRKAMEG